MNSTAAMLLAFLAPIHPPASLKPQIQYSLRVDSADLSGWEVTIRLRTVTDTFRLAMAAHPEYDDRYWRYVRNFTVDANGRPATVTRPDSAIWQVVTPRGEMTVRYRIALPPTPAQQRAAWKPFLTPSGGLMGGPHAFMYLLGAERMPAPVTLDLPRRWAIRTGLTPTSDPRTFMAANAATLMDCPILAGQLREWRFISGSVPHRVVYWSLPNAAAFDTAAFVSGIKRVVDQAIALFGGAPYREYTFLFQDGAYGALEHLSSVTIGAPSADLAANPSAILPETAHEFFHTWNLMRIRPVEYRDIDYRTQPPVSSLWFSEGLTMFYADLLQRRAGIPMRDSTRIAHLERLMSSYLANPAYARFSAESISRVAYNAEPGALGDYAASTHLQGELTGAMLDLIIRDATQDRRSMDDVMRLLFARSATRGIDGREIEQAAESVCSCDVTPFFDAYVRSAHLIDFDRYLGLIGLHTEVTMAPAVWNGEPERDLRIYGWDPEGDSGVRLIVSNPSSIWGQAGLHSRDRLLRMDGVAVPTWPDLRARLQRLRIGDTVRIEVQRPTGPFTATVIVTGLDRPVVRIQQVSTATTVERRRADAWSVGSQASQ